MATSSNLWKSVPFKFKRFFHGTSTHYLPKILKEGLIPQHGSNFPDWAKKYHPDGTKVTHLATNPYTAAHYASQVSRKTKGKPVVLVVKRENVPKGSKLDKAYKYSEGAFYNRKRSSFTTESTITPPNFKIVKDDTFDRLIRFRRKRLGEK